MAVSKTKAPEGAEEQRGAVTAPEVPQDRPQPWSGYKHFAYVGPTLPGGMLNSNKVLTGTFEEIKAYYAPVLEKYPQAERLIFPLAKLGEQLKKVKSPGNIAHKYFCDLVSLAGADKEE